MSAHPVARMVVSMVLCILLLSPAVHAATEGEAGDTSSFTRKGADTCLKCHDEESAFPVLSIFKTPHASRTDPRAPFSGLQCESCHGPGAEHARNVPAGERQAPILDPGPRSSASTAEKNMPCLACHENGHRMGWVGSAHETAGIACTSCHVVHAAQDRVMDRTTQPAVCESCHADVRAASFMASAHPMRFGKMACSDCHSVHDAVQEPLLVRSTVNETCFTCHADKRGPMLWEHAPVTEDCTLCHDAHGSNHPALLTQRPPLLCQQCHSQDGHPSLAPNAAGLASASPSPFLLLGSCTNCHTQVHGSNHPSGAKLLR